ncbi:MAG: hypothetical protein K6F48_11180 [Paludibacteraceae bacterium]|nr:hypothetical protein [Paludibacteraceae bacterium]
MNIGFENGLEGWKCYQATVRLRRINDNSINDAALWGNPETAIDQTIEEPFRRFMVFENPSDNQIQYDGCGVVSLKTNMGNKFLKLGNSNYWSQCEKVSHTFAYDPSRKFIKYAYAMVMQDPDDHEDSQRPSFIASVSISRNGNFIALDSCVSKRYYGDYDKFRDFSKCTAYLNLVDNWTYSDVLSKNWSYNMIDLEAVGAQPGDSVTLSFATFDCTIDGHFGYAYVDAEFVNSKFEIEGGSSNAVCVGDNVTFSCPGAGTYVGETYVWKVNGSIVDTTRTMKYSFPHEGKFYVSLTIQYNSQDSSRCEQEQTMIDSVYVVNCICPDNGKITMNGVVVDSSMSVCVGRMLRIGFQPGIQLTNPQYVWKFNDSILNVGNASMGEISDFSPSRDGILSVHVTSDECPRGVYEAVEIHVVNCICPDDGKITIDGMSIEESFSVCKDQLLRIGFQTGIPLVNPQYVWTFGNDSLNVGNESQDKISNFSTSTQGTLALRVTSDGCEEGVNFAINLNVENCRLNKCNDCPSRFSPTPGEKYVVSGWVSATNQIGTKESFENVYIQLSFDLIGSADPFVVNCYPDGNIIDGWQRISKSFVIPQNAENMRISLKNESGDNDVYFDDIRFHPFNASVKGYVYDPKTLRLAAELDDENYATFYEYDEEGALIRIKKETERGVMTIREARQSKPKISGGN